jgi:hypothetical protein
MESKKKERRLPNCRVSTLESKLESGKWLSDVFEYFLGWCSSFESGEFELFLVRICWILYFQAFTCVLIFTQTFYPLFFAIGSPNFPLSNKLPASKQSQSTLLDTSAESLLNCARTSLRALLRTSDACVRARKATATWTRSSIE